MSVEIKNVLNKSKAYKKRLKAGDKLLAINGNEINDILDYSFYSKEEKLLLEIINSKGKIKKKTVRKEEEEDLGLEFETYLMDKQHSCKNKCVFCFIDQLPKNMRSSLYFKDDDSRMSFFFGNYITLTNLDDSDIDRIIKMHISPVNISVHTMNPELRVKMMKNPNAGKVLQYVKRLADAGIKLNTQLVLCPGLNDGKELEYSIEKLSEFFPALQSIAAVPVGLTKHRDNLEKLEMYDKSGAENVIDIIEKYSRNFLEKYGSRLVFAADEFYLKAERQMPKAEEYEDFPQIENGVGMWQDLRTAFLDAVNSETGKASDTVKIIATGEAAFPLMKELSEIVCKKFGAKIEVVKIINRFFGETVSVAGLITGEDLTEQLKGKKCDELLISATMLRSEGDMFLDSMTVEEAEKILNMKITAVHNDGYELLEKMLS